LFKEKEKEVAPIKWIEPIGMKTFKQGGGPNEKAQHRTVFDYTGIAILGFCDLRRNGKGR
jgi:hypothetical protein